jgi:signal transduction histidine kinase
MTQPLASWLKQRQKQLLQRWIALLEPEQVAAGSIPSVDAALRDNGATVHPDEQRVMLDAIYSGFIHAANGSHEQLDKSLRLLRVFRNHGGEDELPRHLALIAQFRRIAWDVLATEQAKHSDWYTRGVELDQIIEYATVTLSASWVSQAATTTRELNETRLLVESLTRDAEASDRTTLHVSTINEISRGLASTFDRASQIKIVGEKLLRALETVSVAIWQSDLAAGCLRIVGHWELGGQSTETIVPDWTIRSDAADDLIARAFRTGEMQIDIHASPEEQGRWYRETFVVLAMPLISQASVQGVIVLQELSGQVLNARAEQEFIRSAASQAAIAFESARLYEEVRSFNAVLEQRIAERTHELQVERDTLETLNAIALEISSTLDEHLLMQHSLSAIARLVGAEHGSISLLERETEHLVDRAVLGRTEGVGYTRFPIGRGIIGWVAQQRRAVLAPDVANDPRWIELPEDEEHGRKQRGGALIAVPLIAHHELQGVLVLSHDQVGFFKEEHQRLVEAAANQIATGIHNALIYQQLEQDLLRRYEMQQIQQQAVSQSQAILQSLSDGVIVCDSFGSVLTVNPAAERILERPIDELLIWNMPELFRRLLGRRAEELPVEDLISEPRDAQGNPRFFSATIQLGTSVVSISLNPVLSSEKHTPMGALAVFRDITREVESDRLKTEFIGTVSHELRTPMTSIKGFTQLLVMGSLGPVNETQREFLGIIQTNAERMIAIINDLLDITKIETGTVELDLRSLHLAEALSNVVMELQPKIQERTHELSISIPPGLPLVRADQRRFNQILYNLLSNAVKYTHRGGQIALEAREVTQDIVPEALREGLKTGRYVQIDIRDTGVGIAKDELERIFERFYRTENPLKVEAGGTGLGLSLVRPLVQLFGGRVWVESVLGEGSTFRMVLPAL